MTTTTIRSIRADEVKKEIRAMNKATKEICKSKESARAYLRKAGFITASGKLTKRYGG